MKPIMLATDGSPASAEAAREAIELASLLHVPLITVTVAHVGVPSYGYYGYSEVYSELRKSEHEHAEQVLADIAETAGRHGVECETVPLEGPVVEALCKFAGRRGVAMIVLGAHGWGAIHRLVFGSVSQGVLHSAPCPVLIARPVVAGESTWVDEHEAVAV